ncbi:MAG: hypothetical protein LIO96_10055, partial [Lachnospiraceae bacterium]|nr:hypothetical protein [Lachnospiraceae bacterium]
MKKKHKYGKMLYTVTIKVKKPIRSLVNARIHPKKATTEQTDITQFTQLFFRNETICETRQAQMIQHKNTFSINTLPLFQQH